MERCSKGRYAQTVTLPPGVYDVRCAVLRPGAGAAAARATSASVVLTRRARGLPRKQYKFNVAGAWQVSAEDAEGTCAKGHLNNQARRKQAAALARRAESARNPN
jgi:hypothetical protein